MVSSIVEAVYIHSKNTPDKTAVTISGSGSFSYTALYDFAHNLAMRIKNIGVKQKECILVRSSHTIEYVAVLLAVQLAGCIFVPLEKSAKPSRICETAEMTNAALLISDEDLKCTPHFLNVSDLKEGQKDYTAAAGELSLPGQDDEESILFTTGTTGKTKGVLHTHESCVGAVQNYINGPGLSKESSMLITLPLNHGNGLRHLQTILHLGGTAVLMDGLLTLGEYFNSIRENSINALTLTPSALRYIMKLAPGSLAEFNGQLECVITYSDLLPDLERQEMMDMLPDVKLIVGYGCTESIAASAYDYKRYPGRSLCAGKPNPGVSIKIADDNKAAIKSSKNNPGNIAISGSANMKAYWNEPELTKDYVDGGYLYTSDFGYIDKDGFLYVLGRKDDVINIGGLKVAPEEVEGAALECSAVKDCACIGVPHEIFGNAVKLFIVMKQGEKFIPGDILKQISQSLESYKVPKYVVQIDSIPRTKSGKKMRQSLKGY